MKKLLIMILLLFLLSAFSCAMTNTKDPKDYNLSGKWGLIEIVNGCGSVDKKRGTTIEITQNGSSIMFHSVEKGWEYSGELSQDIILIPGGALTEQVTVEDSTLMVSDDTNTLTGVANWDFNKECSGNTKLTYQRKH